MLRNAPAIASGGGVRRALVVALLALGLLSRATATAVVPAAAAAPAAELQVDQHGRVRSAVDDRPARSPRDHGGEAPSAGAATLVTPTLVPLTAAAPLEVTVSGGFTERWRWVVPGRSIGARGIAVADLDADGSNDLLCSGLGYSAEAYAYVLHAVDGGGYEERWAVPGNAYAFARAVQLDADAQLEVLVGSHADVRVYDGKTHVLQRSLSTSAGWLKGLEAGDLDADGDFEVVVIDESDLFVYDLETGALLVRKIGFGGLALALGEIDGDANAEIGIAGGTGSALVLDGKTLTVQWGRPSGFGRYAIVFGDLDADGLDEVATALYGHPEPFYGVRAFDPGSDAQMYEIGAQANLGAVGVGDLGGSRAEELLFSQWSGVSVRDGGSGAELWGISYFSSPGASGFAVGDADDDGITELLWGGAGTSIGSSTLQVADAATQLVEWESLDLNGPFYALDAADVDRDGTVEVIAGAFEADNGYADGRYLFLGAADGDERFVSEETTGTNWTGLWQVRSANLDVDPQLEVCVTTSQTYVGRLICYDGVTHLEQWRADIPHGLGFGSLEIVDVDRDGALDVVAGTVTMHSGAPGTYVYAYRANGEPLWRTPDLGTASYWADWTFLRVTELDGDPQREVVVGDRQNGFAVIRGESGEVDFVSNDTRLIELTALATPDRDGDGLAELLVGRTDGAIVRLDPTSGAVLETIASGLAQPVNGLAVADLNGDGVADYAYGRGLQLVVRSGASGSLLFASDLLGLAAGAVDGVKVVQLDGDTAFEILVNSGNGVAVFDTPGPHVFADGFEQGITSPWSGIAP